MNDMLTSDRDAARKRFADSGLTYAYVTSERINDLKAILQKHLDRRNQAFPNTTMRINKRNKKTVFNADGSLNGCQITMRSHYFTSREAITFSSTGFIGFAGWADDTNVAPLIAGFIEWIEREGGIS